MELKRPKALFALMLSLFIFNATSSLALAMGKGVEVPRISKEQLMAMMDNPDVIILDVRESESWKDSKNKIQGAIREDPEKDVQGWADQYSKDKTLVFYCS